MKTDKPLEEQAGVEGRNQGDERVGREGCAREVELVLSAREGVAEDLAPLQVDLGDPLLELRAIPSDRVQLGPDLRVACREILVDVVHRLPPLLDERDV